MWSFKIDYCEYNVPPVCDDLTAKEHDNINLSFSILFDTISHYMYEDFNYLKPCKVRANLVNKKSVLRSLYE